MAEMVLEDSGVVADVGVDDKHRPPPPDPERAPKGWRFDKESRSWIPRKRSVRTDEPSDDAPELPRHLREDSAWASDKAIEAPLKLTEEQRADLESVIELLALPALTTLPMRDPYCGQVLLENWDRIREHSLPLIARSPALVEWLTKAGGARDWLMFAAALRPVATAVVRHHVTHTVELDEKGEVQEEDLSHYAA